MAFSEHPAVINRRRRARALAILLLDDRREIYEAGEYESGDKSGRGSGRYFVTYTGEWTGHYQPLTQADIKHLVREGLLRERYEGCYERGPRLLLMLGE